MSRLSTKQGIIPGEQSNRDVLEKTILYRCSEHRVPLESFLVARYLLLPYFDAIPITYTQLPTL